MIFNKVLDAVLRAVLTEVCGTQEAHHRLDREKGEKKLVFYADADD